MSNYYNNQKQPPMPPHVEHGPQHFPHMRPPYPPWYKPPGDKSATLSLVMGILSIVLSLFGVLSIFAIATGITGIILAIEARKRGYVGGKATAGLVCSIIGLALSGIIFISCFACWACAVCTEPFFHDSPSIFYDAWF